MLLRNIVIIKSMEYTTQSKAFVKSNHIYPEGEFILYVAQGAVIETLMVYLIIPENSEPNSLIILSAFIPMSFVFEIIFDLFFYLTHRYLHMTHSSIHKIHHEYVHLKPSITFYQDIYDILLTVTIPFLISVHLIQLAYPLSSFEISLLLTYKVFIEIAGHSGKISNPSSSFPQCIWLPKLLGIEMYSEDHSLHHSDTKYNFSKRFILWDKVFGTYKPRLANL
jgi:sterol desaturase/sphingolipid hydroxylase (fatty acid hydroxylase superfamily)